MKKSLKYLFMSISTSFILPIVTNAATLSLDGTIDKESATYNVKYNPDSSAVDSVTFKIEKTNDDLIYELDSDYSGCNKNKMECTILTTTFSSETTIATVKIKNPSTEKKETTISISGDLGGASKTFTLNSGATTTTTKIKSNNANLTNLGLSVGNLDKTFDGNTLEYTITGIKDTINSVTINPTCDNCDIKITCPNGGCSVSNTKRVTLQAGANEVNVNVTSEDGTSNKTYKLNIYRGDVTTSSAYLQSLKIKDVVLTPTFNSMTNDYSALLEKDLKELDITTVTEDPNATVEIKGNKDLKVGENTITITISSSDGENKQVYTIKVTKEVKKDTAKKVTTTVIKKKKNNTWLIILLSLLGLGIIILVYILLFRKKKNKKDKSDKNNRNNKDDNGNNVKKDTTNDITDKNELDMLEESKYNVYGQEINEDDLLDDMEESDIEKENTDTLRILEETKRQMKEEPKQDVDDALDDLMKTKKLELGDLDF